ncbi:hypothetical protein [Staphylococcus haemolyticus]|uniref:hypothetical protein n=1 Tax=Staphylococcus haemolyticus TaxID=1283 RepID=UPI001F0A7E0B|nr:hypothetical protein [Staphylococcus haemolyticus]MCH4489339.1 hypothetical protein [Staphylococcus haemolyticus]MDU0433860.1 hypothetical protein [Staphylococcus haemolyticus]
MKIVYLCNNGQSVLVFENEDGEFIYPDDKWTDVKPPNGLYAPIYYDGQKWVGQEKEEFEQTLPEPPIDDKDLVIANLSQQLLNNQSEIENVKKDMAVVLDLLVEKGSVDDVQSS